MQPANHDRERLELPPHTGAPGSRESVCSFASRRVLETDFMTTSHRILPDADPPALNRGVRHARRPRQDTVDSERVARAARSRSGTQRVTAGATRRARWPWWSNSARGGRPSRTGRSHGMSTHGASAAGLAVCCAAHSFRSINSWIADARWTVSILIGHPVRSGMFSSKFVSVAYGTALEPNGLAGRAAGDTPAGSQVALRLALRPVG